MTINDLQELEQILAPHSQCWHLEGHRFIYPEEAQFRTDIALYGGAFKRNHERRLELPDNTTLAWLAVATRLYEPTISLPEIMDFLLERWQEMDVPEGLSLECSFRELAADLMWSFEKGFFTEWDRDELLLSIKW